MARGLWLVIRGGRVAGKPGDEQDDGERYGRLKRADPAPASRRLPPHLRRDTTGERGEHAVDQHHERTHQIDAAHARGREEIRDGHQRRPEEVPREAREEPAAQPFDASPEDRLERKAPASEPTPRAGVQPAEEREVARAERGEAQPPENHERPRAVVLADRGHPRERREPEGEAAAEPRPRRLLRRGEARNGQQRRKRHRDGRRLAERRVCRDQQRGAQGGRTNYRNMLLDVHQRIFMSTRNTSGIRKA